MNKEELIKEYSKKMEVIDRILDNIITELKYAKNEDNKNIESINDLICSRTTFLTQWNDYKEFIQKLENLK